MLGRPTGSSDAIVLRTWPSGETSVIASLLSLEHGYVRVLAKGARGGVSALRHLVQPGRLVNAEYSLQSSRELQYLSGGELLLDVLSSVPSLSRTAYLFAAMEMIDRCRPGGDRDQAMFDLCRRFLQVLSSSLPERDVAWFYQFEMRLLDLHGVGPELTTCVSCGRDGPDLAAGSRFCPPEGGLVCRQCCHGEVGSSGRPLSRTALDVLRTLSREEIGDVASQLVVAAVRREVGIHLHGFLAYHVPAYRLPTALNLLRGPQHSPDAMDAGKEHDAC